MTRVTMRAPKRPTEGTKFVSRPLMPKKSEIAQQADDGAPREAPKRGPGDAAGGAAKRQRADQAREARAEQRRVDRKAEKERGMTCFQCRKPGHSVKNCPSGQAVVCYHCGADDHTTKGCPTPSKS
ncbi:Zinc finger CCHC domain-containing protein 9, partial [Coemansia helicoidea]